MNCLSAEHRPNILAKKLEAKILKGMCARCFRSLSEAAEISRCVASSSGLVVIHALVNQIELNRRLGILIGPAPRSGRVAIELLDIAT